MLKARLAGAVLLPLPACVFGPAMVSFGWTGALVLLGQAAVAVIVGSGLFCLAKRLVRPTTRNWILWSAGVGLLTGLLTCFVAVLLSMLAWQPLGLRGDEEAYSFVAGYAGVAYGLLAIPFGWGLGQSGWRVR